MITSINNAMTGMINFQRALNIVGNNIANLDTHGFRASRIVFREMPSTTWRGAVSPEGGRGGSNPIQSGMGSTTGSIDITPLPGELQTTGLVTDMAVQGEGYFVLSDGRNFFYTRDGSFNQDGKGNLLFSSRALAVMGWAADSSGQINTAGSLSPIQIPLGLQWRSNATGNISAVGNLDASSAVYQPPVGGQPESGGVARVKVQAYDSLGSAHEITLTFKNTGDNKWTWEASLASGDTSVISEGSGTLTFDSAGKCTNPDAHFLLDPAGSAAQDQKVNIDYSSIMQLAGTSSVNAQNMDGYPPGVLQSFTVDTDGIITGKYSSGLQMVLGRMALASFSNLAGLEKVGNNILQASANSGAPKIVPPKDGDLGGIMSGALEMSNVDLNSEFTKMIIAQRAFQSNSRVIRVSDEMWQELMNING
ncbi:MAG: flagellar hook protein FlgE [bacterium]